MYEEKLIGSRAAGVLSHSLERIPRKHELFTVSRVDNNIHAIHASIVGWRNRVYRTVWYVQHAVGTECGRTHAAGFRIIVGEPTNDNMQVLILEKVCVVVCMPPLTWQPEFTLHVQVLWLDSIWSLWYFRKVLTIQTINQLVWCAISNQINGYNVDMLVLDECRCLS